MESRTAPLKRGRDSDGPVPAHGSTDLGHLNDEDTFNPLDAGRQRQSQVGDDIVDDFLRQAIPLVSEQSAHMLSSSTAPRHSTGVQLGTDLLLSPSVTPNGPAGASDGLIDSTSRTWNTHSYHDDMATTTQAVHDFEVFNFFDLDAPRMNDDTASRDKEVLPSLSATATGPRDSLTVQDDFFYVSAAGHSTASLSTQAFGRYGHSSSGTESDQAIPSPSTSSIGRIDTEEGRMMDMWTNVPSGFEYVIRHYFLGTFGVLICPDRGADWDAYITNMLSLSEGSPQAQ